MLLLPQAGNNNYFLSKRSRGLKLVSYKSFIRTKGALKPYELGKKRCSGVALERLWSQFYLISAFIELHDYSSFWKLHDFISAPQNATERQHCCASRSALFKDAFRKNSKNTVYAEYSSIDVANLQ